MIKLHLPSGLTAFTGGIDVVELEAARVSDALALLTERFPALGGQMDEMAVAVDGEIYQQPGYQPLGPSSEVYLVPRIAGG
ncbi:MAG TPA: MoaD/ThiS family protein [Vicinamibacterales bacterium]|jgi:molybdopterin converting factor small subunit